MTELLEPGFEKVNCAFCGADRFATLFHSRDIMYGATGNFTISRCRSCSLVMQNPRPVVEKIAEYYSEGYEPHTMVSDRENMETFVQGQESRRALLEKHVSKGTALDVGSGDGRFLLCLKRAGWKVSGCELVERAALMQRDEFGLEVKSGDLISAGFPSEHFDAVTFWSVFEHLYNPLETIVEVERILKPGGKVIMSVPNFNSVERVVFRGNWFSLSLPYHMFHYTPRTLGRFASKADLELEKVYFSTTATSLIYSIKLAMFARNSGDSRSLSQSETGVPMQMSGNNTEKNSGTAKQLLFNKVIVPAIKIADMLHVGAYTNFVFAKKP